MPTASVCVGAFLPAHMYRALRAIGCIGSLRNLATYRIRRGPGRRECTESTPHEQATISNNDGPPSPPTPPNQTRTHQLLGRLVLERGRGDLVLLREELVVVGLLEVEFYVLERLALAKVVVVLAERVGGRRENRQGRETQGELSVMP